MYMQKCKWKYTEKEREKVDNFHFLFYTFLLRLIFSVGNIHCKNHKNDNVTANLERFFKTISFSPGCPHSSGACGVSG